MRICKCGAAITEKRKNLCYECREKSTNKYFTKKFIGDQTEPKKYSEYLAEAKKSYPGLYSSYDENGRVDFKVT